MMRKYLLPFVFITGILGVFGCVKPNANVYNAQAHLNEELPIIQKYIAEHNFQYTPDSVFNKEGIYYQIINPGVQPDTGRYRYKNTTLVDVKYTGKVLGNTQNFDQSDSVRFALARLIPCWPLVIQKIQPKGRIRFISTSVYGYQSQATGSIPANSILDFDVEVLKVTEQ